MTNMIVYKKTINNIVKDTYRKALSIQFSLGGFSFCISNLATKEVHHFTGYTFENSCASPEDLLTEINHIYQETPLLNQAFESITIIHQNNLSSLVPTALFDENELKRYLDFNIKTLSNDYAAFDSLSQLDIKNVYVPYVNINNFFFQKYGAFEYKHHATVLIDKLILHTKNSTEKQCFVHVTDSTFDLVVIEQSKLLFHNTFSFSTKEDFIYYILFTAEQLQLNPEELLLIFIGDIEKESELFHITYQYIRHVDFIQIDNSIFAAEKDISNHTNYITTP